MAKSLGKKSSLWPISPKLIQTAAKMGDVLHLPLNYRTVAEINGKL
jgi:hypothetical protein